jgi:hypothetical protein
LGQKKEDEYQLEDFIATEMLEATMMSGACQLSVTV